MREGDETEDLDVPVLAGMTMPHSGSPGNFEFGRRMWA